MTCRNVPKRIVFLLPIVAIYFPTIDEPINIETEKTENTQPVIWLLIPFDVNCSGRNGATIEYETQPRATSIKIITIVKY